ncbi:MAG: hypothetical protein WCF36_13140 [Candidatus Nanopelagicales bacterium]
MPVTISRDPALFRLGDAQFAVYYSNQAMDIAYEDGFGALALVGPDGAVRAIRTAGMDTGVLDWNSEGLYFSDVDHELVTTAAGTTMASAPKEVGIQIASLEVEGTHVSVYNEGFTDTGYATGIVTMDGAEVRSSVTEGMAGLASACADGVYLVASATGPLADTYPPNPDGVAQEVLIRGWPGTPTVVDAYPAKGADDESALATNAPCTDGVIAAIVMAPNGEVSADGIVGHALVLRTWNTVSGKHTELPVLDESGNPPDLTRDELLWVSNLGQPVLVGALRWLSGNGTVYSTDLTDGLTTPLVTTDGRCTGHSASYASFTSDSVYLLNSFYDKRPIQVVHYPLNGATPTTVATLPTPARLGKKDIRPVGFAVSPDLVARGWTPPARTSEPGTDPD